MNKKALYNLAIATLLLTSCTDYLGIKPRGYDVASRVEQYEGLIFGSDPMWAWEVFPYMAFEQTVCDADAYALAYSATRPSICNAYKWEADIYRPDDECAEWNGPSNMLYPLNVVINGVMDAENGTEEKKLALRSEARVIRAYYTFLMAQFFGAPYNPATAASDPCVPIITKASTIDNDFKRSSVAEVYDFVIGEMEESLPYLPDEQEHISRAFKLTGYVMLGKVYWMMGEWKKADEMFAEAMKAVDNSGCSMMDYSTLMVGGEMIYPADDLENPELIFNLKLITNLINAVYAVYYGTPTFTIKTEVMKKYFSKGDLRLCLYSGINSGKTAYNSFSASDIYYVNLTKLMGNIGITLPDFYIMYAETAARTGKEELARELLQKVRINRMDASQAVVAASGDDLVRFAVEEGFREHIGYGNNWFDMRRLWNDPLFQDLKKMYVHTDGETDYTLTEDRLVMRIPPSVLQWHPDFEK